MRLYPWLRAGGLPELRWGEFVRFPSSVPRPDRCPGLAGPGLGGLLGASVDAVHAVHAHVHQHDVRVEPPRQLHGLRAVAVALSAYIPETAASILAALGQPEAVDWSLVGYGLTGDTDGIGAAAPLFPRLDSPEE